MPPKKKEPNNQRKGKILEQVAAALHMGPGVAVTLNARVPTKGDPNEKREIDVLLAGKLAGYPIRIAVECKNWKREIKQPDIDQFISKLHDIGIATQQGIYVTTSRYTRGALARAAREGLQMFLLSGLTEDRLKVAVYSALQSVVYHLLVIRKIKVGYKHKTPARTHEMMMFYNDKNQVRILGDIVWSRWLTGRIPLKLGPLELDLTPTSGVYQEIRGKRVEVESVVVNVDVIGLALQLKGRGQDVRMIEAKMRIPDHPDH